MKRANSILAAAFLLLLAAMAAYTLRDLPAIRQDMVDAWNSREESVGDTLLSKLEFAADHTEAQLNAALDREHFFIQLYGGVQRLTGQRFVEDNYSYSVIRLSNGALTFGSVGQEQKDVCHNARAVADFAAALGEHDIPFTAILTPQKLPVDRGYPLHVPEALQDYHNQEADQFLGILEEQGVHTIRLKGTFEDFYRTDHHWNAWGAFEGYCTIMEELSRVYGFAPFAPALDVKQYTITTHKELFLGSQGKRVGTLYAGVDDFTLFEPNFDTEMRYLVSPAAQPRAGTMPQALYFTQHLEKDYFNGNPYQTFCGGDWGKAVIDNLADPDGPRVVMIRDSFGGAITPFLALQFGQLTTIDLRAYPGENILGDIAELDPDFVLLLYNPSTVVTDGMFEFPGMDGAGAS